MKVLGVDPHITKPYGYALMEDDILITFGESSLVNIWDNLHMWDVDLVVVEDQYMAKNYNTAKRLSWSAGKVMGLCEVIGVRCVDVNVATWKSKMKAQKGIHVERVQEIFGKKVSDDEASAILIAKYASEYISLVQESTSVAQKKTKKAGRRGAKKVLPEIPV